jgi:hypothetical protein
LLILLPLLLPLLFSVPSASAYDDNEVIMPNETVLGIPPPTNPPPPLGPLERQRRLIPADQFVTELQISSGSPALAWASTQVVGKAPKQNPWASNVLALGEKWETGPHKGQVGVSMVDVFPPFPAIPQQAPAPISNTFDGALSCSVGRLGSG